MPAHLDRAGLSIGTVLRLRVDQHHEEPLAENDFHRASSLDSSTSTAIGSDFSSEANVIQGRNSTKMNRQIDQLCEALQARARTPPPSTRRIESYNDIIPDGSAAPPHRTC